MTVRDLIKNLKRFPQDADVLLSRDEEGNGFRSLYQIEVYHATPEGNRGDFQIEEHNSSDKPINSVVFWPA